MNREKEKARRRVAKVHARIADRRRDFLHKLSTRLVRRWTYGSSSPKHNADPEIQTYAHEAHTRPRL